MAGFLDNGLPVIGTATGAELLNLDTLRSGGSIPQSGAMTLQQLATAISFYGNILDKVPVSGTRYYVSWNLGTDALLTGIGARIGSVGGTDSFIFELHNSAGALVATTTTAGVTVGTANTWQQIAFTTPYQALAGSYFIAVQLNGTTARLSTVNAVTSPLFTGSATGTFGTGAAITPPTTYTANLGPVVLPY